MSGQPAAMHENIEVLDRPDVVRQELEAYLRDPPWGWIRRWIRRRRLKKLEGRGVFLEPDGRGIASIQDLDCHCATNGLDPSPEAWAGYRKLLPFLPEEPPEEATLKATARRSLAEAALQDDEARSVCEKEAERRTGRTRAALLEVVARTYEANEEPARAVGALRASLDPDPEQRTRTEEALSAVMDLPVRPVESRRFSARGATVTLTACADATEQVSSYCSKVVLERVGEGAGEREPTVWELHAIRPHKHRVRCVTGSEVDEWVTLGRHHFRGPTFLRVESGEAHEATDRRETGWLLVDKYLAVLASAEPVALEERDGGSSGYHVVEYGPEAARSIMGGAARRLAAAGRTADADGPVRLWLDAETKHLVRAEWSLVVDHSHGGRDRYGVVQGFAAYDRAPDVVPPPFWLESDPRLSARDSDAHIAPSSSRRPTP